MPETQKEETFKVGQLVRYNNFFYMEERLEVWQERRPIGLVTEVINDDATGADFEASWEKIFLKKALMVKWIDKKDLITREYAEDLEVISDVPDERSEQ